MKSKKLIPTDRPSVNAIPVYQEQYNKLWYDLFEGGGALEVTSMTLSGDLTVIGTTTLNGNLVLGDAATDSLTINAEATYSDIINYSNATTITAGTTQTMAGATALTEEINNVTTCANANDGVALPTALAGRHIYIKNSGATNLRVWTGNASDTIDAQSVTALGRYVIITPGASLDFYAKDAITWETNKDASLSLSAPTTAKGALQILSADSAGDTVTTITNASQTAARTYTIPDAGAATANFMLDQGTTTAKTITTLTSTTVNATTLDTNVAAAAVTLAGTTLAADGTDGAIPITITPKASNILSVTGTAALPTYSFTSDPNTGMFSSGADAIGFATGGTERWIINSSGALNPLTDNTNDIGNGTVNVRDIYITRGLKGISANFGTRGVADATCTLETYTDGKDVVSILTLTNFIVGAIPGAGALSIGNLLFTFPAGVHVQSHIYSNVGFTCPNTAQTPVWGIGSVQGSGAFAVLNGTATQMDYITEQTAPDSAGTADPTLLAVTAGLMTGISLNVAGSTKTVYLNAAETWAADNAGNLTASGTITIKWTIM